MPPPTGLSKPNATGAWALAEVSGDRWVVISVLRVDGGPWRPKGRGSLSLAGRDVTCQHDSYLGVPRRSAPLSDSNPTGAWGALWPSPPALPSPGHPNTRI